jgi:hypothetical protein
MVVFRKKGESLRRRNAGKVVILTTPVDGERAEVVR